MQTTASAQSGATSLDAATLSRQAAAIYTRGPLLLRRLQHYRPWICPFGRLIEQTPSGASVLDVGCGGGLFLCLLAANGRISRGQGFDVSGDAFGLARDASGSSVTRGTWLVFEQRSVEEGWPDGAFDMVSIVDVLHHVPPDAWRAVLDEALRHLKPGGTLLYKDMCRRPRWRAVANRMHDLVMARQWIHYVPIEEVDAWAAREGLHRRTAERINTLWYGHELRVFTSPGSAGHGG